KDVLVLVGGSWTTCTPDEAADPTLRCTVTVWTWCLTRGLRSRLAFAAGVAPRVSEIATTPASRANARPAAIVIADLFVMALPPIDRCLGRDPEVLMHPGGVVPVQVAHDRVVALGHVDREHLRGAGLHRRIAGLPHVGESLGVFVEPVRLPFEPGDRERVGRPVGLEHDH